VILYNPHDGDAIVTATRSSPKHCFLMTRLGDEIPEEVRDMRAAITKHCKAAGFTVIDAGTRVTGRDFLLKIWGLIAASPLSVGLLHPKIPAKTQANIYYELGIAQALGKETLLVKAPRSRVPSDFIRTEYVNYDQHFDEKFSAFMQSLPEQADHYETVADQLDRNPVLALDYLRRAYLITGEPRLHEKAKSILQAANIKDRARNSVEQLTAAF